jgi:hypothetical protein
MTEKEYLILLDGDARKRHYHHVEGGKIIKFVVQLEFKYRNTWREALRYDCAHNYVHKDSYNNRGEQRKLKIYLDYEEALTFADDNINENWQIYRIDFLGDTSHE